VIVIGGSAGEILRDQARLAGALRALSLRKEEEEEKPRIVLFGSRVRCRESRGKGREASRGPPRILVADARTRVAYDDESPF